MTISLLIMSATLDNDRLQRPLPEAPVVVSEGRAYPVERRFSPLSAHQRFDEAVAVAAAELLRHEQGSMLLFLPGVGEIQRVLEQLTERVAEDVILCPLYGALPLSEQRKAILPAPAGKRKVVLATNIAETSLTIEGIRLVVDSAQERVARFDPRTGLTRLVTQRISQASMTQRAGRAGRLSPGICLHLLGKEQAERAAAQSEPEILHSDLSALLLELLQWGCHDPAALAWLDQPPAVNLPPRVACWRRCRRWTASGCRRLAAKWQRLATSRGWRRCWPPRRPMTRRRQRQSWRRSSRSRRAADWWIWGPSFPSAGQLAAASAAADETLGPPRRPARCRANGGAAGVGLRRSHRPPPRSGRALPAGEPAWRAMLDADDALGRHEWLIAPLLLQGSASPDARMLLALPVEIGELIAARPELAKSSDTVEWDEAQGTLKAWRRTVIGQLVIKTQPLAKPSEAELHQAMLNGIREKGLGVLNWTPEAEQLRLRLHCAAQWLPEEAWPAVDDASLLASLEAWLLPQMNGVHSLRALKALDLRQALQDWLPWPLRQKLDRELPTHYTVPTGSRLAIRYHAENPPALAVRMQGDVRRGHDAGDRRGAGAAGAGAAVACPASAADHPRSERLLARELPRGAERDEGTLSEARLAGRSGQRRPDPPQQKILVAAAAGRHPARPVGSQTLDHLLPEKNTPPASASQGRRPAAAAATAGSTGVAAGSTPARWPKRATAPAAEPASRTRRPAPPAA